MASINVEAAACSASPGPQDRMQRTKFEIPFGYTFDNHGVSSPKSVVHACTQAIFEVPGLGVLVQLSGMQSAARRQLFICYFLRGMKSSAAISVVATLFINHGRGILPWTLGWIAIFGTFFSSPPRNFHFAHLAALRVAHGISDPARLLGAPRSRRRLNIAECRST
jgi:hypothetical protein